MTGGRPLRFLAVLLCGWTGMRAFALYREGGAAAVIAPVVRSVAAVVSHLGIASAKAADIRHAAATMRDGLGSDRPQVLFLPSSTHAATTPITPEQSGTPAWTAAMPQDPHPSLLPLATLPPPIARGPARLAGSAWGIARGGGVSQASGGQLGGSQAGVRVTYALGESRRIALAARLSTPLAGRGAEGAIGLDWQPTRLPVHALVERRFALDGGRGGTMLGVIGGFGPAAIAGAVTLEGYGQAGGIVRDGVEGFIDGALRVAHPVAERGKVRLDVGFGAWGGAQRGAARFDVGPSLGVVVPVGDKAVRLTADWRQRIAGDAHPDSGPALSIGTNF